MNEDKDNLEKALDAIRNEQIPEGPSKELVDSTVTRLTEIQSQSDGASPEYVIHFSEKLRTFRGFARYAAAAVLLIVAGYAVGRVSAPQPPDIEELQSVLEPAIRRNVVDQLRKDLNAGLTTCYDQLTEDLERRHNQNMLQLATHIMEASSSVTNERLGDLVESINTVKAEERQWFTRALERIDSERLRDKELLSTALVNFAIQTGDELKRTQQGVAQLLSYRLPDGSEEYEIEK